MPCAAIEKEIERLDETQRNTVVLFVRFLLSQKAAAPFEDSDARPRRVSMYGALKGKVGMTSDFNAPVEDFAEYM